MRSSSRTSCSRPWPRRSVAPPICCSPKCGRCSRFPSHRSDVSHRSEVGAIDELIAELARLPGIGRKTAQRLTFHLLQQTPEQAGRLAAALSAVAERVRPCTVCGNPTEGQPCPICADPRRDAAVLYVVEEASAVGVVERATDFRGRYHVLGGRLSPLDGVGPESLRLDLLVRRVQEDGVREVILAT